MNSHLFKSGQQYSPLFQLTVSLFYLISALLFTEALASDTSFNVNTQDSQTITHSYQSGITIVYRLDSAPMQFKNERDHADGILIDLWRLWSIKSGIPVHFIGAYNKEAQEMVADGRADINAGLFESSKREKFLDFSLPMLDSRYSIFYQNSINSIETIKDLQNYRIGVTQGSFHEHYLREHYPKLHLHLYDGYQKLFAAARNNKIDGFVTQLHYLQYHLSQENDVVTLTRTLNFI